MRVVHGGPDRGYKLIPHKCSTHNAAWAVTGGLACVRHWQRPSGAFDGLPLVSLESCVVELAIEGPLPGLVVPHVYSLMAFDHDHDDQHSGNTIRNFGRC